MGIPVREGEAPDLQALLSRSKSLRESADKTKLLDWTDIMDCSIHVSILSGEDSVEQREGKRAKISASSSAASSSATPSATVKTIKAHSLIVASNSEYFKAALLKGHFSEADGKVIQVDVGSDEGKSDRRFIPIDASHMRIQKAAAYSFLINTIMCSFMICLFSEFEVLRLLIQLCYGSTFTKRSLEEDVFEPETLINLVIVANMFEVTRCIVECCDELRRGLASPTTAVLVIGSLAHLEGAHDPINHLLEAAVPALGALEDLFHQGPLCKGMNRAVDEAMHANMTVMTNDVVVWNFKLLLVDDGG